jgi:ring-1,2-phenylacetyl-CoA epoxidase subunit PaaD
VNAPVPPALSPTPSPRVTAAWGLLETLTDPEIPVVSLREMGILREVRENPDGHLDVVITPTYSGCPAMTQIEADVQATLDRAGLQARVVTRLSPAWTTDWMDAAAREKLRTWGIAPPACGGPRAAMTEDTVLHPLRFMRQVADPDLVPCPRCGSERTTETSHFGSTACKALYRCLDCLEPFDYFKPH